MLVDGWTKHGDHVTAVHSGTHPLDVRVFVNGKVAERTGGASLLRDGGTRIIPTELGTLTLPQRLRDPDRTPRWDGVPLLPGRPMTFGRWLDPSTFGEWLRWILRRT